MAKIVQGDCRHAMCVEQHSIDADLAVSGVLKMFFKSFLFTPVLSVCFATACLECVRQLFHGPTAATLIEFHLCNWLPSSDR